MPVNPVKSRVSSRGHFIKNRKTEFVVGVVLFVAACILIWDSSDARGSKAPWPAGVFLPW